MKVSKNDIEYIAKLAKLKFDDGEAAKMQDEMNKILQYVDKLNELDTSGIEPLSHVIDLKNVDREDAVNQTLTSDDILGNAPAKTEKFFRVPKVIG
jgi:aspartyl-tRNA(Asn)/glutamyl-tRNA(Gln) amidotransferase subunit C